jgi:hypothetical protein
MTQQARALLQDFARFGATDTTCFLGHWPYRLSANADVAILHAYAGRLGLESIWISHLAALFGLDTRSGNEALMQACGEDSLFRVFATINPREPGWERELSWAVDGGVCGVRIAPGFHGYSLVDATEIADACRCFSVPLQILARLDDARVRHPRSHVEDLSIGSICVFALEHGGQPLLLSGLNKTEHDYLRRQFGTEFPPGLLADLWHVNGPLNYGDALEPKQWVFGSGFPVQTAEATALQLSGSTQPDDALRMMLTGNAAAISHGA